MLHCDVLLNTKSVTRLFVGADSDFYGHLSHKINENILNASSTSEPSADLARRRPVRPPEHPTDVGRFQEAALGALMERVDIKPPRSVTISRRAVGEGGNKSKTCFGIGTATTSHMLGHTWASILEASSPGRRKNSSSTTAPATVPQRSTVLDGALSKHSLFSILIPGIVATAVPEFRLLAYFVYDRGDPLFDVQEVQLFAQQKISRELVLPLRERGVECTAKMLRAENAIRKPGPSFNVAMAALAADGADYLVRVTDDAFFAPSSVYKTRSPPAAASNGTAPEPRDVGGRRGGGRRTRRRMRRNSKKEAVTATATRAPLPTTSVGVGWQVAFRTALLSLDPPNVGVVGPAVQCYPFAGCNTNILTFDCVHATHLRIFPTYYPSLLSDWWLDDWITHVYGPQRTVLAKNVVFTHVVGGDHKVGGGERYGVDRIKSLFLDPELRRGKVLIDWSLSRMRA